MRIFRELSDMILNELSKESEYSKEMIQSSRTEDCVLIRMIWIEALIEAGLTDSQIVNVSGIPQQTVNRCRITFDEKSKQSFMMKFMMNNTRKLLKDYLSRLNLEP